MRVAAREIAIAGGALVTLWHPLGASALAQPFGSSPSAPNECGMPEVPELVIMRDSSGTVHTSYQSIADGGTRNDIRLGTATYFTAHIIQSPSLPTNWRGRTINFSILITDNKIRKGKASAVKVLIDGQPTSFPWEISPKYPGTKYISIRPSTQGRGLLGAQLEKAAEIEVLLLDNRERTLAAQKFEVKTFRFVPDALARLRQFCFR